MVSKLLKSALLKSALIVALMSAIMTTFVAVSARMYFGSIAAASAFARGDEIFVERPNQDLGEVVAGENQNIYFNITNLTSHPIKLTGSRMSCSCTTAQSMPESLPAHNVTPLRINFKPPTSRKNQAVVEHVNIFVNSSMLELRLSFKANIARN